MNILEKTLAILTATIILVVLGLFLLEIFKPTPFIPCPEHQQLRQFKDVLTFKTTTFLGAEGQKP